MNRNFIASELLKAAQELTAIGKPLTKNVRGPRNTTVEKSNTSFAPAISKELKKNAVESLEKNIRDLDLNPSDLTREWSRYFTYIDPNANNNKYHYYAVYSFEHIDGSTRYVGWNCSGRIGRLERSYDLTLKARPYPAYSESDAIKAVNGHLRKKTSKGYELTKMTRG